ncbi:uncharacterized protein PG998_003013 [Apiospora kogelbergensis]|uniref:uncharacterized protein n=1 Tax=Apiospora kogelbergensis TaxID=1337665 RepID=UPI00312CFAE3
MTYIGLNIFCLTFRVASLPAAALRAGDLALLNQFPLILHFAPILFADYRILVLRIHSAAGFMSLSHILLHVVSFIAGRGDFNFNKHLYAYSAVVSACFVVLLSLPSLRRVAYELFLWIHRLLATVFIVGVCFHLLNSGKLRFRYFIAYLGLLTASVLIRLSMAVYRNMKWGELCTRAIISDAHGFVHITLSLPRPCEIDAGQYVLLCVPRVSLLSFAQSHPFVVASWAEVGQNSIELIIQPRRGFTGKLLRHCRRQGGQSVQRRAFITGPHGTNVAVNDYRTVLLVASGPGVIAMLPYLRKVIHGYYYRKGCTRRVHLIWMIQQIELVAAAQPFLNEFLDDDTLGESYVSFARTPS